MWSNVCGTRWARLSSLKAFFTKTMYYSFIKQNKDVSAKWKQNSERKGEREKEPQPLLPLVWTLERSDRRLSTGVAVDNKGRSWLATSDFWRQIIGDSVRSYTAIFISVLCIDWFFLEVFLTMVIRCYK